MELNILEDTKNKLVVELKGESHALCNALKNELWANKKVKMAGYNIAHPLVGIPKLVIETDSGNPRDVLKDTVKKIKKDSETLLKSLDKALK